MRCKVLLQLLSAVDPNVIDIDFAIRAEFDTFDRHQITNLSNTFIID